MTTITIQRSNGRVAGVEASGHSGYAELGSDIVCAAVSSILQTTALGLTEVLGLKVGLSMDLEYGEMYLILERDIPEDKREKVDVLLETMLLGLKSVEYSTPDYVLVEERIIQESVCKSKSM